MEYYSAQRGHQVALTLTGADQVAEGPDNTRCAIVFPSVAHTLTVSFGQGTGTNKFLIAANVQPFTIDSSLIGDLIYQEIHVSGTAADAVTLWIGNY